MAHAKLNDIGVTLLEKNCYHQALDTFRDAMRAIKRDSSCSSVDETCIVQENARQRLLCLETFPHVPSIKYSCLTVQDLSTAKSIDSVLEQMQDDVHKKCLLSVRFGDKVLSEVTADLASSVIEYNCGILHQAYSMALLEKRRREASNIQHQKATRLLKSSDATLEKLSSLLTMGGKCIEGESLRQVLFMHLVVLLALHAQVAGTSHEKKVRDKIFGLQARIAFIPFLDETPKEVVPSCSIHLPYCRTPASPVKISILGNIRRAN
jgi:hypothetical protein